MLVLSNQFLSGAPTFQQFIRTLADRGDLGTRVEAVDAGVRELTTSLDADYVAERMLSDGRVLECRRRPLAQGGLILLYTDVTEPRHTEFLVRDSERQIQSILDNAPVALAVIGQEDGLKHVNSRFRRLFALSKQVPPDKINLAEFLSRSEIEKIQAAEAGQPSREFESKLRRADGGEFWSLVAFVRFVFDWAPAVLTGFYDITRRRVAEANLREELRRKQAELAEARTLQLELLPPSGRGTIGAYAFSADVVLQTSKEVGGDLVDYFRLDDNLIVLVIGDVAHKGAGAALFMARTHSLMRSIASRPDAAALFREPADAVRLVNATLAANNATCMFVTLLLATFDAATGQLGYIRAGHVPPLLRRADGGIKPLNALGGPPLGLDENAHYRCARVALRPGDCILAVTDGITEAVDPSGAQFGNARVEEFLAKMDSPGLDGLGPLIAAVRKFEAGQPSSDDVAALLFTIASRGEGHLGQDSVSAGS